MAEPTDKRIAERIDGVIKELGLTYAEVAKKIGVTPASVWNWANGRSGVSVERLVELGKALDMPPAYFAFGEEPMEDYIEQRVKDRLIENSLVEIDEVFFTNTPSPLKKRAWCVSKLFVDKTMRRRASDLFLFEMKGQVKGQFCSGDFLIADRVLPEKPEDLVSGYYIFFAPYISEVAYVSAGYRDGVIYSIRQGDETKEVPSNEITLLGKIVGTIKKLNNGD